MTTKANSVGDTYMFVQQAEISCADFLHLSLFQIQFFSRDAAWSPWNDFVVQRCQALFSKEFSSASAPSCRMCSCPFALAALSRKPLCLSPAMHCHQTCSTQWHPGAHLTECTGRRKMCILPQHLLIITFTIQVCRVGFGML